MFYIRCYAALIKMRTKLLKKLRKRYILQTRNGKYKVFDRQECLGMIYNQTDWIELKEALKIRRKWILEEAIKYKKPKRFNAT